MTSARNRIVLDPALGHGKPLIRGTRVPVTVIVGSLAGGMTFEDVQREYDVTANDIRAALRFVGKLDGQDTRAIQQYLGHKNITHTVRYTELSPERFKISGKIRISLGSARPRSILVRFITALLAEAPDPGIFLTKILV